MVSLPTPAVASCLDTQSLCKEPTIGISLFLMAAAGCLRSLTVVERVISAVSSPPPGATTALLEHPFISALPSLGISL